MKTFKVSAKINAYEYLTFRHSTTVAKNRVMLAIIMGQLKIISP